ncbi:lipopolysaccharide assembly protein LapA domain-containing protein [Silanimonas sp.]|jgi:uncharacterized integral membrane protein|uniref:lipopolysaccharide assembly protein LapA domain-containing protein n=1 Tax=Silanimonas sp. TaxID=1929290 RepID=UPI0037CC3A67
MRLIRILLAFLCIAFGIGVVALNADAVNLDLLWIEFSLPLGLLLLSVLLLGALLGGLAALLSRGTVSTPVAAAEDDEASAG